MTDHPFKEGDRVRCIHETTFGCGYIKGEVYIVKKAYFDEYQNPPMPRIMTEVDSLGSTTNGWCAKFFELAERKKSGFGKFLERVEND